MSAWYHFTGIISAFAFCLCLIGFLDQLRLVCMKSCSTLAISLNQIVSTLLAFGVFALYGAGTIPFNHYLVWPRVAAVLLLLGVLFGVWRRRRDFTSMFVFFVSLILALLGFGLVVDGHLVEATKIHFRVLSGVMALVLAQGYIHQILKIRKLGTTGAISLRMHQMLFFERPNSRSFWDGPRFCSRLAASSSWI